MNVEIKIDPNIDELLVIIHTPKLTQDLFALVELLESTGVQSFPLIAKKDDKSFIIEPEQIEIIRVEGGVIKLYNQAGNDFSINKTLNELIDKLGGNFIRISKSAIVNKNRVDHLSPSFSGTVHIVMKNGINDYVSKNYLGDFKKRLGL